MRGSIEAEDTLLTEERGERDEVDGNDREKAVREAALRDQPVHDRVLSNKQKQRIKRRCGANER
jgi:hypothetical protein